ncbi:Methanogenic corrinoid protein MtbC1 [Candidatus Electrothrix aarhusensis]|uniref:Methanogenic corrinoid protein MtbC1 n=1 Tax=Candidatus Electrothrix aarhusensis TaxID=1859131 RepID=A0A3S3RNN3_9BACT|nr:Methanogenic corrinoid protein MtbC1 [Candidatus Electrothrix aarhusensis]
MISSQLYQEYLNCLLEGKRLDCTRIVQDLLDRDIPIKALYNDLFEKSLYRVGQLWEFNRISVAKEHLATAITEGLLNLVYPRLFELEHQHKGKRIVISCAANEFHQIGGKMVADICELNGWDAEFLGANMPLDHMLLHIQETKPDLVGLSLTVYFNMSSLKKGIEVIRSNFTHLDIFVGGQAFLWGGTEMLKHYSGVEYIPTLNDIEKSIKES